MKAFLKNSLLVVILLVSISSAGFAIEYHYSYFSKNKTYCDDTRPFMVGFFNGAGNDSGSARKNMDALRKLYGRVQHGFLLNIHYFITRRWVILGTC